MRSVNQESEGARGKILAATLERRARSGYRGIRRDVGGDSRDRRRDDPPHRFECQQRILIGWQFYKVSPLLPASKIIVQSRRARAQRAEAPVSKILSLYVPLFGTL